MDFKKFGIVIVMLGLLIAGYGCVQLAMNLPVQPSPSGSVWKDLGRGLDAAFENVGRERRRGSAIKVVLAGGLILILGFGIRASAKDGSVPARS